MALVKLDTPIKDFVVNVLQGSPAHTAIKVIEYKFTESRFTTSNDSRRVFSGINTSSFFFLTSLQPWLWRWNWWMGNDRHSFHSPTNICWQSSSTQQRKRLAARGLVDRGGWESTQRKRSSRKAAPRKCRSTPGNSHFSLFPYRLQEYLVSHWWRMYHKRYSCGAYCRQPGEIIYFDHYVSFDFF